MKLEWRIFKDLVTKGNLGVFYFFDETKYQVLAKSGYFDFMAELQSVEEKQDFEINYKQNANVYPLNEVDLLTTANDTLLDILAALPSNVGLATSANQVTEIAALASIDGHVTGVSTASAQASGNAFLASIDTKVTGVSTSAKQDTGNASLASIDGKLNSLGQKTSAGSVPTVAAVDATYSAAIVSLNIAGSATDFFSITGSASKTIKVKRIELSFTSNITLGASQTLEVQLAKRSTANSSGTSTTPTVVPHDSSDAAGTAVVRAYTANPTLGTLVGILRALKFTSNSVNTTNPVLKVVWEFERPVVLRGTSEVLAVNLNGNSLTSDDNAMSIEWSEV